MAYSVNTVTVSGNLTREPEQKGNGPVKFGIAWNKRVKDKATGEWTDEPSFFDVECWEREVAAELQKGEAVTLTGRIEQERWEQDGQKRSRVKIVAETVSRVVRKPKVQESDW